MLYFQYRLWFLLMVPPGDSVVLNVVVYGSTVLIGIGGTVLFVISLVLVADLIDKTTVTIPSLIAVNNFPYSA